jgi:hypothetical protein
LGKQYMSDFNHRVSDGDDGAPLTPARNETMNVVMSKNSIPLKVE